MSRMVRVRRRRAPVEASDETIVYLPDTGLVKVGELKARLKEEARVTPTPFVELEKAAVTKVVQEGGKVTRTKLNEILGKVKQERGVRRGVTLAKLMEDGFLARVKVPKVRSVYAVTGEGARKAGIEVKGKP